MLYSLYTCKDYGITMELYIMPHSIQFNEHAQIYLILHYVVFTIVMLSYLTKKNQYIGCVLLV